MRIKRIVAALLAFAITVGLPETLTPRTPDRL